MKVICLISHEVPLEEGKFLRYEAGKEYEFERCPEVYFGPGNARLSFGLEAPPVRERSIHTREEEVKINDN